MNKQTEIEKEQKRLDILKEKYNFVNSLYKAEELQYCYTTNIGISMMRDLAHDIYNLMGNVIIGDGDGDQTYIQTLLRIAEQIDYDNIEENLQHRLTDKSITDYIKSNCKDFKNKYENESYYLHRLYRDLSIIIENKTGVDVFKYTKVCYMDIRSYLDILNFVYNILDEERFYYDILHTTEEEDNEEEYLHIIKSITKQKIQTRREYLKFICNLNTEQTNY